MTESSSRYFNYLEAQNPEVLLSLTQGIRKNIQRFFERHDNIISCTAQEEAASLLERCEAVLTLVEHELWLNCDDGK